MSTLLNAYRVHRAAGLPAWRAITYARFDLAAAAARHAGTN